MRATRRSPMDSAARSATGIAVAAVAAAFAVALPVRAQSGEATAQAVASWIVLDAPPGAEGRAQTNAKLPGWSVDAWGNYTKRAGSGRPLRVVACALDQTAYVVSQITDQGYLRLRRSGQTTPHQLWDQFHEGQRMRVLTKRGVVKAISAVANGHFTAQHRGDSLVAGVDQLWVDVGASTRAGAEALGIALLDPVLYDRPAWTYEHFAAGPGAGSRAGCAAVATAAQGAAPASGETIYVLSTQRIFAWTGLRAMLSQLTRGGRVNTVTVFDDGRAAPTDAPAPAGGRGGRGGRGNTQDQLRSNLAAFADSVAIIAPRVKWPGTLVESIHASDASELIAAATRASGSRVAAPRAFPLPLDTAWALAPRTDAFGAMERQFLTLADLPGSPGHEWRVRNAITAALPKWARDRAVTDSAGNLVVTAGPERDPVAFIAHMDEVGYEVSGIRGDGTVTLRTMGGAVSSAWEGRPALLHFDADASGKAPHSLQGVFVPRDTARLRNPGTMLAWFGVDSATLVARGVRAGVVQGTGSSVLAYKRGERLGGARLVARSNDDRAGSTALLFAVQRIDPAQLARKTYFVWSVREEGGLNGARAFGAEHGSKLTRVYSIDTFVSSDTPLESPHFAFAPLGNGAVLRGLDNGALTPPGERERILAVARARQIPLQVGTTFGSTDGSALTAMGPVNTGLSWPGRYSHSPAEVLDLRDLESLAKLIAALAVTP